MSLLNDALRKRRAENTPDGHQTANAALGKSRLPRFNLGRKRAVLGGVLIAALAFIVWCWWWPPGETASSFSSGPMQVSVLQDEATTEDEVEPIEEAAVQSQIVQPGEKKKAASATLAVAPAPSPPAARRLAPPKPKQRAALPGRSEVVKRPVITPNPSKAAKTTSKAPTPPPARNRKVSAVRMYQKARTYHRQGQMAEAIAMYREVLKIDPNHFDTGFNLTSAYLQTGAYNKAHAMAADLYRKRQDNPQVALNLAIARIGVGQPRQAIDLLDRFSAHPEAPLYEIYFHKGVAHRSIDEPHEAVVWYQKAEQIKSGDPRLLFNTAVALDQNRQYGPAVNYYQKYLKHSQDGALATRKQVARRIRTLQAELAAYPHKEKEPQ